MSVEDKIRRAEEIYYKRRNGESIEKRGTIGYLKNNIGKIVEADRTNEFVGGRGIGKANEKNLKLLKKMIKQIIVCIIIYGIFYITVNNNYVFSEDFTNKAREILNQDIDFKSVYLVIATKWQELYEKINKEFMNNSNTKIQDEEEKNNEIQNNMTNDNENNSENNNTEENISDNSAGEAIGGANDIVSENIGEDNVETENNDGNNVDNLSQMEQDANYIKNTINFIKPIDGKITSRFGIRNPTTASVPKNHTGTDIAAETGTKIVSATEGKVILASTSGDYGKHLKVQTNDVVVVYAHCNNLYVNEGESISQGQEIAEVGATGNATGPHLHFEVRYQNRYVDPQMILEL